MNGEVMKKSIEGNMRILFYQQMTIIQLLEGLKKVLDDQQKNRFNAEIMKKKKYLRFKDACDFFGIRSTALRQIIGDADAAIKVGNILMVDIDAVNRYFDNNRIPFGY